MVKHSQVIRLCVFDYFVGLALKGIIGFHSLYQLLHSQVYRNGLKI